MASALVGGALLGTAFNELLLAVKYVRSKISSFQPVLKRLESTLVALTPRLHEITRLNQQLDLSQPHSGMDDLIKLVSEGKELVVKCSNIHNLNLVKKVKYSKLLLDLDNNLLRYFTTVLPLDQYTDIKNMRVVLNQMQAGAEGSSSLQTLQQETFELLLDQLVGHGHQFRKVISICGMIGIAKKLYDYDIVKCRQPLSEEESWRLFQHDYQDLQRGKKKLEQQMALELAAGAAFSELILAVKDVRRKISSFQPALKRLELTLEGVTPRLHEITRLNQQLDLSQHRSGTGINDLIILLCDGKELVVKCSNIHNLNLAKKVQYSKLLLDLDFKLSRYFTSVLPLDQCTDIKNVFGALNQVHCKLLPTSNDSESSDKPSDEPSEIIMQVEECIQLYAGNDNIGKELRITVEDEESKQCFKKDFVNVKLGEDMVEMQDEAEGFSSLHSLQQETFEFLLDQLVGRGHQRRKVISICGMGGIGKTTLAKKLYDRDDVKCHFDAFAWVSVSQTFKIREILASVLVQLCTSSTTKKISEMSDDELAKELNFVQQKKKCLVIIDNIWREDDWNALKHAFPIEKIAGVILLTTRNRYMGLQVDPNCHIHECQPLSEEESWELFQQEAFKSRHDYQVSTNMEDLGREMVKKCSGLPLAIVSIGKLLAGKDSFQEWSLVHKPLGMSEIATGGGVLTLAAQKLNEFLIQEASFSLDVNDEMVSIRDELIWMQAFLEDAEQRQCTDKRIRQWITEIRSFALRTEDIIDDYYTKVKGQEPSKRKLLTTLQKFFGIARETNVNDIVKEIKALKERLSDIKSKMEVYGINNINNDVQEIANAGSQDQLLRELRRTTSLTDEEDFVGIDDDVKPLRPWHHDSSLAHLALIVSCLHYVYLSVSTFTCKGGNNQL